MNRNIYNLWCTQFYLNCMQRIMDPVPRDGCCSCTQVPVASLVGKTIGLYFSAEWCVPCAKFTPKLISVYEKIKHELAEKGEEDFEVVLISSDRDQASFDSYYSTMPWLALPFGDPEIKNLTRPKFEPPPITTARN